MIDEDKVCERILVFRAQSYRGILTEAVLRFDSPAVYIVHVSRRVGDCDTCIG